MIFNTKTSIDKTNWVNLFFAALYEIKILPLIKGKYLPKTLTVKLEKISSTEHNFDDGGQYS